MKRMEIWVGKKRFEIDEIVEVLKEIRKTIAKLESACDLVLKTLRTRDSKVLEEAIETVCKIFNDCEQCPISEYCPFEASTFHSRVMLRHVED